MKKVQPKKQTTRSDAYKMYMADLMLYRVSASPKENDREYLAICNKIIPLLEPVFAPASHRLVKSLPETLKLCAVAITSYVDDFVCDTGLWRVFQQRCKTELNVPIPVVRISDDYAEDDINADDIRFIIWQFMFTASELSMVLNPHQALLKSAAQDIYDIYSNAIDEGLICPSDEYDKLLNLGGTFDNNTFFRMKDALLWLIKKTFLFLPEFPWHCVNTDEVDYPIPKQHLPMQLVNDVMFLKQGRFMALTAADVLAEIANCSDTMREAIRNTWRFAFAGVVIHESLKSPYFNIRIAGSKQIIKLNAATIPPATLTKMKEGDFWFMSLLKWGNELVVSGIAAKVGKATEVEPQYVKDFNLSRQMMLNTGRLYKDSDIEHIKKLQYLTDIAFKAYFGESIIFAANRKKLTQLHNDFQNWFIKLQNGENDETKIRNRIANDDFLKSPAIQAIRKEASQTNNYQLISSPLGIAHDDISLIDIVDVLQAHQIAPEDYPKAFAALTLPPPLLDYLLEKYPAKHFRYGRIDTDSTEEMMLADVPFLKRFFNPEYFDFKVPNSLGFISTSY